MFPLWLSLWITNSLV